jgi:hypothetical protein
MIHTELQLWSTVICPKDNIATYLNDDIFLVFVCWTRGASQGVQGVTIVYIS